MEKVAERETDTERCGNLNIPHVSDKDLPVIKHSEGIQTNMFVPTMQELFSSNAKLSADHQLMTSALVERGGRSDRRTARCQSLSLQLFPDILGCFEAKSTTG